MTLFSASEPSQKSTLSGLANRAASSTLVSIGVSTFIPRTLSAAHSTNNRTAETSRSPMPGGASQRGRVVQVRFVFAQCMLPPSPVQVRVPYGHLRLYLCGHFTHG